jgi:hypothetical protein
MRMALTTNLSWLGVPVVALVGIAYIWVVSALLGREQHPKVAAARIDRAAEPEPTVRVSDTHRPGRAGPPDLCHI